MWFFFCYFHVILLLSNIPLIINNETKEKENSVFSEVIRNISRVNNVLQELIENYEHIQNMYKSKSFESSDISSDSEIDEVFKEAAKEQQEEKAVTDKTYNNDSDNGGKVSKEVFIEGSRDQDSNETDINNAWFLNVETQKWEKAIPGEPNNTTQDYDKLRPEESDEITATEKTNIPNQSQDENISTTEKSHIQSSPMKENKILKTNVQAAPSMEIDKSGPFQFDSKNMTYGFSSEDPDEEIVENVTYLPYYSDEVDNKTETTTNGYLPVKEKTDKGDASKYKKKKIKKTDPYDLNWYDANTKEPKDIKKVGEVESAESEVDLLEKENEKYFNTSAVKKISPNIQLRGPNRESNEYTKSASPYEDIDEPVKSRVIYRDHKHSDEVKVPDNVFYDNVMKNSKYLQMGREQKYPFIKQKKLTNDYDQQENLMLSIKNAKDILSSENVYIPKNSKNVKHIIHSETFNGERIWKDIAQKRPVKLRNDENSEIKNQKYSKKKEHSINKAVISEDSHYLIEDKLVNKDMKQTQVLRKAYGDACLKVVVKKCYKACKQAGKSVCSQYKCKSNHKDVFNRHSKTGCIKHFTTNTGDKQTDIDRSNINIQQKKVNVINHKPSSNDSETDTSMELNLSEEFKDMSRSGLEGCYPFLNPIVSLKNNATDLTKNTNLQLNILRDRYERACQMASASKCKKACIFAFTLTCRTYNCSKNQRKAYKKACWQQCKVAYVQNRDYSSSDDSDSDDSDESDDDGELDIDSK